MLLKVLRKPDRPVDDVDLSRFQVGRVYEVGTRLANYLLASGFAEPVLATASDKQRSKDAKEKKT